MIKLTSKNFFTNYIIHPFSKDLNKKDRVIALVSSIALGVVAVGCFHRRAKKSYKAIAKSTSSDSLSIGIKSKQPNKTSKPAKQSMIQDKQIPESKNVQPEDPTQSIVQDKQTIEIPKPKDAQPLPQQEPVKNQMKVAGPFKPPLPYMESEFMVIENSSYLKPLLGLREKLEYALEHAEDPDNYPENLDFPDLTEKLIESSLRKFDGFVIGETHSTRASKKFLIDHMEFLRDSGVKYLFYEQKEEAYAEELKEFYSNDQEMSDSLKDLLFNRTRLNITRFEFKDELNSLPQEPQTLYGPMSLFQAGISSEMIRYEQEQRYNHFQLFEAARCCGIQIISIDKEDARFDQEQEQNVDFYLELRVPVMNDYAEEVIRRTVKPNEKYVVFCGSAHARKGKAKNDIREPGLAKRLNLPLICVHHNAPVIHGNSNSEPLPPHSLEKRNNHSYKRYHKILYTMPRWRE